MIAIVECCGNNLASVANALIRLSCDFKITSDPKELRKASKVILPGVGSAKSAMARLHDAKLVDVIPRLQQPVLGICLGMQLLFERSQENDVECLGIMPGVISKLPGSIELPVPHMGWNRLSILQNNSIAAAMHNHFCYFVHSYFVQLSTYTLAKTTYVVEFSAIVQCNNFFGMQFHPEKSGSVGLSLLENFVRLS
jgi:glutamine amidotransferase